MKKIVVIIFCLIILILFGIDFLVVGVFKRVLYANWQIEIPGVYRHEELFVDFFQTGDMIYTFQYHEKMDAEVEKLIRINHFSKITLENVEVVKDYLLDFYDRLGTNIDGVQGKIVYNSNINNEDLLSINNYFLIKTKNNNKTYILLVLDMKEKKIYTFISIR